NTTPADGSSKQALIAREANTCLISALPFKTMLCSGNAKFGKLCRAHASAKRGAPLLVARFGCTNADPTCVQLVTAIAPFPAVPLPVCLADDGRRLAA